MPAVFLFQTLVAARKEEAPRVGCAGLLEVTMPG
jgi:hypothetical protein